MKRYKTPREYVLFLLSRREYSEKELMGKCHKYFPDCEEPILELIKLFVQKDFISDERFCEVFIRGEVRKGNGSRKILQKLLLKGIDKSLAQEKCDQLIDRADLLAQARRLSDKKKIQILKRNPKISDFELKGKMTQYLAGRGFDFGLISEVV